MWNKQSKHTKSLGVKIDIERPVKNSEIFTKLVTILSNNGFSTLETSYDVVSFYKVESGILGFFTSSPTKIMGSKRNRI
jgi:hypothetical protein